MSLESGGDNWFYLPVTAGRYLLKGKDCPELTVHNVSEVRRGRSTGFFMLFSTSETIFLLASSASDIYVLYPTAEKEKLAELLRKEEVTTPA